MAVLPGFEGSTEGGRRRLGRRTRWLLCVPALLVASPLAVLVLPVPGLDGYLTRMANERVSGGLACIAGVALLTAAFPSFAKYDARKVAQHEPVPVA